MIKKNWKSYLLGIVTGIALTFIVFSVINNNNVEVENQSQYSVNQNQTSEEGNFENSIDSSDISETQVSIEEKNVEVGTLTNPVPLGEVGSFFEEENFFNDQSYEVEIRIDEVSQAQDLPNFRPSFYNSLELKEGYTYYGVKLTVSVIDGSDPNIPYDFDPLNGISVFVDGAESSDDVIDIDQTEYSGIAGRLSIGSTKTGWIGFQVPTDSESIILQVGYFGTYTYMKLK